MMGLHRRTFLAAGAALSASTASWPTFGQTPATVALTNVSYDPTRELYRAMNDAFASEWQRGAEGDDPDVPWRIRPAGPIGDRWS